MTPRDLALVALSALPTVASIVVFAIDRRRYCRTRARAAGIAAVRNLLRAEGVPA